MSLADIIPPDGVLLHLKASTLEQAIHEISARAAELTSQRTAVIEDALMARARLGASLGDGVVIPHARLDGLHRTIGFFARPLMPIKHENAAEITMLFVLLAPKDADAAHLKILASIAGILRRPESRDVLLQADRARIYDLLTGE